MPNLEDFARIRRMPLDARCEYAQPAISQCSIAQCRIGGGLMAEAFSTSRVRPPGPLTLSELSCRCVAVDWWYPKAGKRKA
jgi:hypothetical protein